MKNFWKDKKVLLTGGSGFLGSFVTEKLYSRGCKDIFIPRSADCDLTKQENVKRALNWKPDIIIHLAAVVGGIGANMKYPGTFFYKNLLMGTHLIEESRKANIEKFVAIGTICAYPKFTPVPFKEEDLWAGYPEETNAPYGLAKKMMLVQLQAYAQEFGMKGIYLLPVNLYGPRDNFDPNSSHVIPALIRKCLLAKENNEDHIIVWGSGAATREFLYVEDCAEAIVLASEMYNESEPVNIGSGEEVSIKDLCVLICKLIGYNGKIIWNKEKPDGQPRRCLDINRANNKFGFKAATKLEEGLKNTIAWYEKNRRQL